MNNRIGASVVFVLLLLSLQGCGSMDQKRETAQPAGMSKAADGQIRQLAKLFEAYGVVLFSGPLDCPGDCPVTITMATATVSGHTYCVAQLPESLKFSGTAPGNPPKTITWTLNTSTLGGNSLSFHDPNGILVLTNPSGQIAGAKWKSATSFEAKNVHKVKITATYVPIILWDVGGAQELCAAGDPKIVNE